MEDLLQVGVIASTHGIKGEVKVFPTTDDPMRFKKLKSCILDTGKEQIVLNVQGVKFFKQYVILKFKEFDNINEVEKYKGKSLLVTRANAVKLEKDEYFITDLIGLSVIDESEQEIGILTEVLQTGANDVYVIETKEKKEILLPAIRDCILSVSIETGRMKVHILEGLLD